MKLFYTTIISSIFLLVVGCAESSNKPEVGSDFWEFDPDFIGGSKGDTPNGVPVPPADFKLTPNSGNVLLTWRMPKHYKSDKIKIGYRIFRRIGENTDNGLPWNFETQDSIDWSFSLPDTVAATTCKESGECSYVDRVGGPLSIDYAIMAYWDITDFSSPRSVPVFSAVISRAEQIAITFAPGFTETLPKFLIGTIVDDLERKPSEIVFNLSSSGQNSVPWYLWEGNEIWSSDLEKRRFGSTISANISDDGMELLIPDFGYSRIINAGRGSLDECNVFPDLSKPLCQQILVSKPIIPFSAIGQRVNSESFVPFSNPMPVSRTLRSRSASIERSSSGRKFILVSDEQRIIIRETAIFACRLDPGEAGDDVYGPEGFCGFQWSIGTYSPRQRCSRKDGTLAEITGIDVCNEDDFRASLSDATPPTNYSLRYPGAAKISGKDLYIPDTGNARVVRITNFEEKLKTCGRLLALGDTATNDFCRFDMVVGQGTNQDTAVASRLSSRICGRGGERGGKLNDTVLAVNATVIDPVSGLSGGGSNCQLDMFTDGLGEYRKARLIGDFKDTGRSDISPDTGLLSERTRRMFRSPVQIEFDSIGQMYVLDRGMTRAKNDFGDREAVLPDRVMVWQKNPFSFEDCVPTNPGATVPSCTIDPNLNCIGVGCQARECLGAECNATWFLGQPGDLFGYRVEPGKKPWETTGVTNSFPLAAMDVSEVEGMKGVWAVTGIDASILHYAKLTSDSIPVVHNKIIPSQPETSDFAIFKRGRFSGITLDENGATIIAWDSFLHVGIAWTGLFPE